MSLDATRARFKAYRKLVIEKFGKSTGPDLCGNCRFWFKDIADSPQVWGRCRRHAPKPKMEVVVKTDVLYPGAWWPETFHKFWCGEYKPARRWWWPRRKNHL